MLANESCRRRSRLITAFQLPTSWYVVKTSDRVWTWAFCGRYSCMGLDDRNLRCKHFLFGCDMMFVYICWHMYIKISCIHIYICKNKYIYIYTTYLSYLSVNNLLLMQTNVKTRKAPLKKQHETWLFAWHGEKLGCVAPKYLYMLHVLV